METQYVARDHIWFRDSYKNPESCYSDYIVYTDKTTTNPYQLWPALLTLPVMMAKQENW